jgi:hypothetical protein
MEETMSKIEIERNPDEERLNELGIYDWPIWTKEVSEFPLEGDAVVTPDGASRCGKIAALDNT